MKGKGDLRRTVALFRRFATGQSRMFLLAVLLLAAEAGTAVLEPFLLGYLIDVLTGTKPPLSFAATFDATIGILAISLVGLAAANSLGDSLAEISLAKAGRTVGFNLRQTLFSHLQKLSLAFHLRRRVGDVLTRITADVTALEDFLVQSLSDLMGSLLLIVGTLAFLLAKSVQVTLLALVIVPLLASVSGFFARRIKAAAKDLRAREGELASTAQEMLTTIGVVQIYGRNSYEQSRFAEQSRHAMSAVFRTAKLEAAFSFTVSVLETAVVATVIWVGAVLIGTPPLTVGTLVMFIALIQQMFKPTRRIIKEWNTIAKLYASVDRISELLDREPAVVDSADAFPAPRLRGEIEFVDVSFAYQSAADEQGDESDSRLALDSLSFCIPAGEVVALVGHSGAGKSTIAQLLPRLYDPHEGAVLIDGFDIRAFTLESLRAQISMVMQETVLFSGTVAANIAYGAPDASMEDVVTAARRANAHDFISALPQGYETVLGERAATLSGGQRQRLSIARAFARDAPVLVLDEPTTGLDAESSDLVRAALRNLVRGKTAIVVSHDFTLIRDADRVLVVSAGRILEDGSPSDLLARGGLYADLHERQLGPARGDVPTEAAVAAFTEPHDGFARSGRRTFETALMQALPLPASPERFRQLTGVIPWAPFASATPAAAGGGTGDRPGGSVPTPRASAPSDGDGIGDPLSDPALARWLPGLRDALDPAAMRPVLAGLVADGWVLEWCTAGKVLIEPGTGASLRYRLGLRDGAGRQVVEHLVGGRIFDSDERAEDWLRTSLAPLAARAAGRHDLRMFTRPVHHVAAMRLVLHAFPLDADLPGLLDATDPDGLAQTLDPVLRRSVEGLVLEECRPHLVQYARRGRCVLRYEVLWHLGGSPRTLKQLAYGKVYGDDQGAGVGPAVDAVRSYVGSGAPGAFRFLVPGFLGYLPRQRLALLEALPGTPAVAGLVRRRVTNGPSAEDPPDLTLETALQTCGRIAATLHTSEIHIGPLRTLGGEVDAVLADLDAVADLTPGLADRLRARLSAAGAAAHDPGDRAGFAHGDLTSAQILFDGPLSGLVDLDTVCQAEPALDLGQFLGYLGLQVAKAERAAGATPLPGGAGNPLGTFLQAYLAARGDPDPVRLLPRVSAYRTVTLTRVALRSWLQLKPERARLALSLLDDPDPWRQLPAGLRHAR